MFSIIIVVVSIIVIIVAIKNKVVKVAQRNSELRLREYYRQELMLEKEVLATLEVKLAEIKFKSEYGRTDITNVWYMEAKVSDQKEVVKALRNKVFNIDAHLGLL
jgi:hypothetical protein